MADLNIKLDFGGGSEYLFGNQTKFDLQLPEGSTIQHLLDYMRKNLLQEREELFYLENTVRPGVLVLVNDTDWEVLGNEEYEWAWSSWYITVDKFWTGNAKF